MVDYFVGLSAILRQLQGIYRHVFFKSNFESPYQREATRYHVVKGLFDPELEKFPND